jgi:hypothetical protein
VSRYGSVLGLCETLADHDLLGDEAMAPRTPTRTGSQQAVSTHQVQVLHLPAVSLRYTQRVLAELQKAGLVDRAHAAHGKALWYPTAEGRLLLRSKSRLESRGDHGSPWQTDSVLRTHTLALNDTGIAFVKAARTRGDECNAFSWRHDIAHPLTTPRQGREQQWLVVDALLSYLEMPDGDSVLRQRFIKIDLATTSTERLAAKLAKYKLLHQCRPSVVRPGEPTEPIWRSHYRTFPQILVVLAGQEPADARRRVKHLISLWRSDPATRDLEAIPLHFVRLQQLTCDGPYAPVFISASEPEQDPDWLGRAQGAT